LGDRFAAHPQGAPRGWATRSTGEFSNGTSGENYSGINTTSDFSGLTSSACALANAAARLAMDGLDLCTAALHAEEVEAHGARFRALGPDAMPGRLLGILWHQTLQFGLGLFMFEMRRTGPRENRSKLRPGIGGAHVDDADGLDAGLWRLDPKQPRWLAALDTAPVDAGVILPRSAV
jgi:hypothetical protein